jgi:ribose transport system permease protein/putative xylitol transport system permease protein
MTHSNKINKFKASLPTLLPAVFLFLLIIIFSVSSPAFLKHQNIMNIMRQSSILLIVACGTTFIILQGSIDLSMGSIVTLAGIAGALLIRDAGLGLWAVPVAMLIGALAGFINGVIFAYGKVPSFLVTLGAMFVIEGVGLILCNGQAVQIWDRTYMKIASGNLLGFIPNIAVWAIAVYLISIIIAVFTKFGRYMYAIGGGERAAKLSGVPVDRFKLYSFILAGLLSGLAGALMTARLQSGSPQMGSGLLLNSIAAVVIGGTALTGGVGGPHKTIFGVMIMGILSNGLNINAVDPYLQTIIKGVIVVFAVFLTIDRSKIDIMK